MAEPSEWEQEIATALFTRGERTAISYEDRGDIVLALDAARKEALEKAAETVHAMDPSHYVRWGSDAAATALDTAEDRIRATRYGQSCRQPMQSELTGLTDFPWLCWLTGHRPKWTPLPHEKIVLGMAWGFYQCRRCQMSERLLPNYGSRNMPSHKGLFKRSRVGWIVARIRVHRGFKFSLLRNLPRTKFEWGNRDD